MYPAASCPARNPACPWYWHTRRWVRDWERLVRAMVDEPHMAPQLDPGTQQGFVEAQPEPQVLARGPARVARLGWARG